MFAKRLLALLAVVILVGCTNPNPEIPQGCISWLEDSWPRFIMFVCGQEKPQKYAGYVCLYLPGDAPGPVVLHFGGGAIGSVVLYPGGNGTCVAAIGSFTVWGQTLESFQE